MKLNSNPKIIATGYYDGATEGFIQAVFEGQVFFFELIAWDDELQDKRVFALKKVNAEKYVEFMKLLEGSLKPPYSSDFWVPSWSFSRTEDRKKADSFVGECRHNPEIYLLVLGSDIKGKIQSIIPTVEVTKKALALTSEKKVDPIKNWVDLFVDSDEIEL